MQRIERGRCGRVLVGGYEGREKDRLMVRAERQPW